MKDFYELEDWKQCELLFELIERMGATGVPSLEQLSKKEGKAPHVFGQRCACHADLSYAAFPSAFLGVGRDVCLKSLADLWARHQVSFVPSTDIGLRLRGPERIRLLGMR